MAQFKVGDLVKRVHGSWRSMKVGDTSRVTESQGHNIMLEDFPGITFDSRKFELAAETTPEMSLDVAVKSWQDASQQIKELQASLAGFERVMRKHGVKPL